MECEQDGGAGQHGGEKHRHVAEQGVLEEHGGGREELHGGVGSSSAGKYLLNTSLDCFSSNIFILAQRTDNC